MIGADDRIVLREVHLAVKPMDPEEVEAAAELAQREKDQAVHELKQDMNKNMAKIEGRQKTVIDSLRDIQIDNKKAQQDTAKELKLMRENFSKEIVSVEQNGTANQNALLSLIDAQIQATDRKLKEQDDKINLLLGAVCGPTASQRESGNLEGSNEGGKLLAAIFKRIESLEQQEQNQIRGVQEMYAKGASSMDAHIDAINHDIMSKVRIG